MGNSGTMGGGGGSDGKVASGAVGAEVAGWVVGEPGTAGCVCGRLVGPD